MTDEPDAPGTPRPPVPPAAPIPPRADGAPGAASSPAAPPEIDALQPEARFALRGLAAGLAPADLAEVLRDDGDEDDAGGDRRGARLLRRTVRMAGGPPLVATSGDERLRAALAPLVERAKAPPVRTPGTQCPAPEILSALALGRLDGPLMLAEAEHVADCPPCMAALVAVRRAPQPAAGAESSSASGSSAPAPVRRGFDLPLVLGVLAGLAVAVWYLFLS